MGGVVQCFSQHTYLTLAGGVQSTDYIEQCGFAGSGGADEAREFPF